MPASYDTGLQEMHDNLIIIIKHDDNELFQLPVITYDVHTYYEQHLTIEKSISNCCLMETLQ